MSSQFLRATLGFSLAALTGCAESSVTSGNSTDTTVAADASGAGGDVSTDGSDTGDDPDTAGDPDAGGLDTVDAPDTVGDSDAANDTDTVDTGDAGTTGGIDANALTGCDGQDVGYLTTAFVQGVTIAHHTCDPLDGFVAGAALADGGWLTLAQTDSGLLINRHSQDGDTLAATITVPATGAWFAGTFLAVAPSGVWAAVGYTTAEAGSPGAIAIVSLTTAGEPRWLDAPGNYAAVALDDSTLLVDGLGLGGVVAGQGLYVATIGDQIETRLATDNLGASSGDLAVHGDWAIAGGYAGFGTIWPDGLEGSRLFALPVAAVTSPPSEDAFVDGNELTPLGSAAMASSIDAPPSAEWPVMLTHTLDESYAPADVVLYTTHVSATGRLSASAPRTVTTGGVYTSSAFGPDFALLFAPGRGVTRVDKTTLTPAAIACDTPCGTFATCIDGVCAIGCDAVDAEGLTAALGDGVSLAAAVCLPPYSAFRPANRESIYGLLLEPSGTGSVLSVERLTMGTAAPTTVASAELAQPTSAVFPGSYIALGPQHLVAFGATFADFSGSLFIGDRAAAASTTAPYLAPGNYAAVALSDTLLLVNGTGMSSLTGQGLYLVDTEKEIETLVGTNLGAYSGALTIHGDLVLAGGYAGFGTTWPDGSEGNKVYALSAAALVAAAASGTPIDVYAEAAPFNGPYDVEFLTDGRLLTTDTVYSQDGMTSTTTITVHTQTVGNGTPVITSSKVLASGSTYTAAHPVPGTHVFMMKHAGGFALVGE